jgi:hypothetical protein
MKVVKVGRYLFKEQKLHCMLPEAVMLESMESIGLQLAPRRSNTWYRAGRRRHSFAPTLGVYAKELSPAKRPPA